jgi:hypothetical protein
MTLARSVEFPRPVLGATNTESSTAALAAGEGLALSPLHERWAGGCSIPYRRRPEETFYQTYPYLIPSVLGYAGRQHRPGAATRYFYVLRHRRWRAILTAPLVMETARMTWAAGSGSGVSKVLQVSDSESRGHRHPDQAPKSLGGGGETGWVRRSPPSTDGAGSCLRTASGRFPRLSRARRWVARTAGQELAESGQVLSHVCD